MRTPDSSDFSLGSGGRVRVVVGIICLVGLSLDAVSTPSRYYHNLLLVVILTPMLWNHYVVWRRKRQQGGLVLLGTEEELKQVYRKAR